MDAQLSKDMQEVPEECGETIGAEYISLLRYSVKAVILPTALMKMIMLFTVKAIR